MKWIVRRLVAIAVLLAISLAPLQGLAVQAVAAAVAADCAGDPCHCDKAEPGCAMQAACSAQCAPAPILADETGEAAIPARPGAVAFDAAELNSRSDVPLRRPPRI